MLTRYVKNLTNITLITICITAQHPVLTFKAEYNVKHR